MWCAFAVSLLEGAEPRSIAGRAERPGGTSGPSDSELLETARGFPPMPRSSADLLAFAGRVTFASGTPFNDLEYTLFDTDYIEGETNGYDTFFPVDPRDEVPGADTVKLVRCVNNLDLEAAYHGPTGDRIILGTAENPQPFFLRGDDGHDNDYAVIQNFDYNSGHIQLRGEPEQYRVLHATRSDGVATEGFYVFFVGHGGIDLVAFVFPCEDLGETISGNPPQDDQLLCDTDRLIALDDGVSFRFAEPVAAEPVVRAERAVQIGTEGNEIVGGIALDGAGNRYVFGASDGSLGGTLDEESSIFVAQYTSDGSPGWVFELGMANGSLLFDAVADDEHLYAVGRTLGSLPGFTNQGRWDAVLLKLRLSDGALIDSDQFGNSGLDGYGNVVLDDAGHLFVSGAGSPEGAIGTDEEYLVAKHRTRDLENVWRLIQAPDADRVIVSEAWGGLCYVAGDAPGDGRLVTAGWFMTFGGADSFVEVFDQLMTEAPRRVATAVIASAGTQADWVLDNAVDRDGTIYAVGYTTGTLGQRSLGDGDAFVVKLGPMLDNARFVQVGTSSSDMFRRLVIDGDVLIAAGYTYGDSPAAGGHNLDRSMTTGDVLIQRFDRSLEPLGAVQLGTAHEDRGHIAVRDGLVHVGGMTEAAFAGESRGAFDAFLVVLGEDLD
jgi:hypothetical protein